MSFIKEGKTNVKYLLVVLFLALIAGGGIVAYCNQLVP
jgi:hypothetical protein